MNDTNSVVKIVSLTHSFVNPSSYGTGLHDAQMVVHVQANLNRFTHVTARITALQATEMAHRQDGKADIVERLWLRSVHAVRELRAQAMAILEHGTQQDVCPALL
jgi:hypothetical protein